MRTVDEITSAIRHLPRPDFFRLAAWVQHRFDDEWYKEIEQDAMAGKLDHLAKAALADHRAGRAISLPVN